MGNSEMIARVGKIVQNESDPAVIVSAMSGVTDLLLKAADLAKKNGDANDDRQKYIDQIRFKHIEAAKLLVSDKYLLTTLLNYINEKIDHFREFLFAITIIGEISAPSHDEIISLGERLSAALLAAHLNDQGREASFVDLSHIFERGSFDHIGTEFFEKVEHALSEKLAPLFAKKKVPVLTGFFGKIPGGIVHAVGRGYSDFTAALTGSAFEAEEIQIWTDVDGLLSADPRIVKQTCVLPEVSFEEAGELAEFGAKVLHPQTIWPAVKKNIPVRIKNTMNPDAIGTRITRDGVEGRYICKSLAHKKNITVMTITSPRMLFTSGFMADIFVLFKKYKVAIGLISTAEISVTLTVGTPIPKKLLEELSLFCRIDIQEDQAIVCAVGKELMSKKGVLAQIFSAVADAGVSATAISASAHKINVSMIVHEDDAKTALFALHKSIFES